MVEYILQYTVALSGTVFGLIALHRVLFATGIIGFEFKRPDRIYKLFKFSFILHMASLIAFLIIISTQP